MGVPAIPAYSQDAKGPKKAKEKIDYKALLDKLLNERELERRDKLMDMREERRTAGTGLSPDSGLPAGSRVQRLPSNVTPAEQPAPQQDPRLGEYLQALKSGPGGYTLDQQGRPYNMDGTRAAPLTPGQQATFIDRQPYDGAVQGLTPAQREMYVDRPGRGKQQEIEKLKQFGSDEELLEYLRSR